MDLFRLGPLLLGTGLTLGLGAPIAKAASLHSVNAQAFALWPTLAAGALLGSIGLLWQGRPADVPRWLRFGSIAALSTVRTSPSIHSAGGDADGVGLLA